MPELPEVETIVRELRPVILGRTIERARLLRPDILIRPRVDGEDDFEAFFQHRSFTSIARRGKYLLFTLDSGDLLLAHLGMTGKFTLCRSEQPDPPYLCSQFLFRGDFRMDHVDVRRLGRLELFRSGEPITVLTRLGMDPLSEDFGSHAVKTILSSRDGRRRRQRAIHPLLLDQSLISGIGNIYASEALHRAGIRPSKSAGRLSKKECDRLARCLREVMEEALQRCGTTVNDFRRVDDKPGGYQDMLRVYQRQGKPCSLCGTPIRRIRLGGRSAFYCPRCQK